jgi:hypothetical protein
MLEPRRMDKDSLADFLANGEPDTFEYFKESVKDGFSNTTLGVGLDSIKEMYSAAPEERASKKQAQENIRAYYENRKPEVVDSASPQLKKFTLDDWKKSPYYRDGVEFKEGWSEERAKYLAEGFDDRKDREFILKKGRDSENTIYGSGLVGQLVGSLPDPVNLIPFGGATSKTARVGEKLVRASIEGAVGNLAVSGVTRPYWEKRGTESSWQDYVNDVFIGGGMGAGFGLVGHAFSRVKQRRANATVKERVALAKASDQAIDSMMKGEDFDPAAIPGLKEAQDSIFDVDGVKHSDRAVLVERELIDLGIEPETARDSLAPLMAHVQMIADTTGKTFDEAFDEFGATFQAAEFKGGEILPVAPESRRMDNLIESEVANMAEELRFAEMGGERIFNDGQFVGTTGDGTFPAWYADLGVKNKEHFEQVVKSKSGPIYDRIKEIASERMMNGYESKTFGRIEPVQEFVELRQGRNEIPEGADGQPLFKTSETERGAITFQKQGKAVISLFKDADRSTIIHETGHLFLNNLDRLSKMKDVPTQIKADLEKAYRFMGLNPGAKIQREHHEIFAEGFEQFLREGRSPRPELDGVFARFKDWLTDLYKTLVGFKTPLSDDAREVYSSLLGGDARRLNQVPVTPDAGPVSPKAAEAELPDYSVGELEAMANARPGLIRPEELSAFKGVMEEIDTEIKALDEVASFFQGAKTIESLEEAAEEAGISKSLLDKILEEFNAKLQSEDEARQAIEKLIKERKEALLAEAKELKRQAFLAGEARAKNIVHVENIINSGGTAKQSVLSILEGDSTLRGVEGAGNSVDGSYTALAHSTSSRCFSELRKVDTRIEKLFEDDIQFNQNIAKEMIKPGSSGDEVARQAGEILSRYSEELRQRANLAGAKIGKLEGHVPRTHDVEKMIGKESEWVDFMMENLDRERSFSGLSEKETREALRETFRSLITGEHGDKAHIDTAIPMRRLPRNIAKRMGESRTLHFKGPEVEVAYLKKYGQGENILQSMAMHYEGMSKKIALMERLGPNPESTIAYLVDKLRKDIDERKIFGDLDDQATVKMLEDLGTTGQLTSRDSDIGHAMMQALGEVDTTQGWFKNASRIIRAVNSLSKLGSALLSQPTDFVHAVNERRLLSDESLPKLWIETFKDYLSSPNKELQEVLDHVGLFVDSINYKNFNRFDADNINNKLSRANDWMFRWSGQNWHVKHSKNAAAISLAREVGSNISKSWKDIHPGLREMMIQYGSFNEAKWELLRKAKAMDVDGKSYYHPGMIKDIPDEAFASRLDSKLSPEAREVAIKRERYKLEMDLQTFFVEEARNAAPEPDAKVRRVMSFGTKSGTKTNEAVKLLTQFKTFAFVNYDRSIKGRRMMKDGRDYGGLAHHATATLMLGMVSTILKDLAKGLEPADPAEGKTWLRAAFQSGGLGIMGDFVQAGISSRSGADALTTLMGPTFSTVGNFVNVAGKTVREPFKKPGDRDLKGLTSDWVDLGRSMAPAPFSTLWYTRAAMDFIIWHQLKEILEPGSTARSERRLRKEYNQKYLMSPRSIAR